MLAKLERLVLALVLLLVPALVADQANGSGSSSAGTSVNGPVLGFVLDSTSGLRPILGIPGASILGQPLDPGFQIAAAAVSPEQNYVLAVDAAVGRVNLLRISDGAVSAQPIDGMGAKPDRMAISPKGTAAALYYSATRTVQLVTGLPDAPSMTGAVTLSSISGEPAALAVNDGGRAVLVGLTDNPAGSLFVLTTTGAARAIQVPGQVSAFAFLRGTSDALAADGENNQLWLIRDVAGASEPRILAGPDDGISKPVGVAVSRDNQRAFVANAGTGTVASVDLTNSTHNLISCGCDPSGLFPLQGNSVFRLTDPSAGPMKLFVDGQDGQQILFVPADQMPTANSGQ